MLIVERQRRLLDLLRQRGTANLEDLAEALEVSGSTVRRDLEAMEKRGEVQRTHGGAIYRDANQQTSETMNGTQAGSPGVALATRMREHVERKQQIGAYAASLVQPNMTVILDGGSTVILAARQIEARPIQVVTNSLSIAQLYKDDDQVELILAGGILYPRNEVTVGPIATGTLGELHADLLLCSLAGIYGDSAFNINLAMADVEQVMMRQATRSALLMDSSKFGRQSLARVGTLSEFELIVTDPGVDASWRDALGNRLVVADRSS